jgi:hypothetical protein
LQAQSRAAAFLEERKQSHSSRSREFDTFEHGVLASSPMSKVRLPAAN